MGNDSSTEFLKAKEAWEKGRERYASKIRPRENLSGVPIKTVYTPEDLEGLDLASMPGVYPYTRGLLKAIPRMDLGQERLFEITGTVPSLYRLPKGCNFYPRCTQRKGRCELEEPNMTPIDPCHSVSCWI